MVEELDVIFQSLERIFILIFLDYQLAFQELELIFNFISRDVVIVNLILSDFHSFEVIFFFDFLLWMQNIVLHVINPLYDHSKYLRRFQID